MANGKIGAPFGNKHGANHHRFLQNLKRAMAQAEGDLDAALLRVAKRLYEAAVEEAQPWAIQQIADRFDGKPQQTVSMEVTDNTLTAPDAEALYEKLSGALAGRAGAGSAGTPLQ